MLGRTDSRARARLLLAVLLVFGVACVARLGYWQLARHDWLVAQARDQVTVRTEIAANRGTIYDRTGTVTLATTIRRDRLVAYPTSLAGETPEARTHRAEIAATLAGILGLGGDDAAELRTRIDSGKAYVVLARGLTTGQSNAVRAALDTGLLTQVRLEAEAVRVYPLEGGAPRTTIAAHLLGFANREGDGQYGVEGRWQDALAGAPRIVLAERDAAGHPNLEQAVTLEAGSPGVDITLTIDASLQLAVEREVYAAWVADRAKSVSAVVLDPATGEILAQATYPSYDANDYAAIAAKSPERFLDPVVAAVYEPGSVFKMVTAAAVLEAGVVKRTSGVQDQAILRLDGGKAFVTNADKGSKGRLTFEDAVAWSRNVVMSKVALKLGPTAQAAAEVLHGTWAKLGFGTLSGVDVAGEVPGMTRDPARTTWRQIDVANGAFGQGVAVTILQLATAYSAMANGGILPIPHVVARVGAEAVVTGDRGRVLTPALSADLVKIMRRVPLAVPFYRDRTLIPGYVVGGKTGTAQIWDGEKKRWKINVFNYSFVGFVGRRSPEVVVAVRIEEGRPTVQRIGQIEMPVESFELFRRVATDAMATLDLAPVPASASASPSPAAP
ncbi:MAG TPA: penicillin-binding protein 2 [Candidatus Nanopelagicales bacterium]|nr:penicillin-binding protein 2 [Candidatus Nanopelagicales bacterium]